MTVVDAQFSDWWRGAPVESWSIHRKGFQLHKQRKQRIEESGGEPAGTLWCLSQYLRRCIVTTKLREQELSIFNMKGRLIFYRHGVVPIPLSITIKIPDFLPICYQYRIWFVMRRYQVWMTCIIPGYARAHLNSSEIKLSSSGSKYVDIKSRIQRRLN